MRRHGLAHGLERARLGSCGADRAKTKGRGALLIFCPTDRSRTARSNDTPQDNAYPPAWMHGPDLSFVHFLFVLSIALLANVEQGKSVTGSQILFSCMKRRFGNRKNIRKPKVG